MDEDDFCLTQFTIKNTKKGEFNGYANSYFDRAPVDDDTLAAFEDEMVEPYDLETIDLVPEPPSVEEAEEWLEKAIIRYNKENGTDGEDDDDEDTPPSKGSKSSKKSKPVKEDDHEDEEDESSEDEDEDDTPPTSSGSSIRDRLKAARNKK